MAGEIEGVSLEKFEEPIRVALNTYQEMSDGLGFDVDNACRLTLTPDKPNSARSTTDATFQDTEIGKLYVIAFRQDDSTGAEGDYKLADLYVDPRFPQLGKYTKLVPRNKTGIHSEAHLNLVRQALERANAEPILYAGSYNLLGIRGTVPGSQWIAQIGTLGHPEKSRAHIPVTTFTVGYRGGERFGDPHAVYVPFSTEAIQICAFLGISSDIHVAYPNIWEGLNPQYPDR